MTPTEATQLARYFDALHARISEGRIYLALESIEEMRTKLQQWRRNEPLPEVDADAPPTQAPQP